MVSGRGSIAEVCIRLRFITPKGGSRLSSLSLELRKDLFLLTLLSKYNKYLFFESGFDFYKPAKTTGTSPGMQGG